MIRTENLDRYFLRRGTGPWTPVSKGEWLRAEQAAGFRGMFPGEPATAGFGQSGPRLEGVRGRIVRAGADPADYEWDPDFARVLADAV